jgi:hypothetical protein
MAVCGWCCRDTSEFTRVNRTPFHSRCLKQRMVMFRMEADAAQEHARQACARASRVIRYMRAAQ